MKVLKIHIYQPSAHYRIPFSYQRRFTYPIPPLSTVKGLICNMMGIRTGITKWEEDRQLKELVEGLSIGIYGDFETIVKEYIWFRNLERDSHKSKFHTPYNRILDSVVQHPGGQMPLTVDVLHNVNIYIYIYHKDYSFLKEIENAFKNPIKCNSVIHLGRAEDWLIFQEINLIEELQKSKVFKIPYYCWIPSPAYVEKDLIVFDNYMTFFKNLQGNMVRLPTIYSIVDNKRSFDEFAIVKLFEKGNLSKSVECYVDKNVPIICSKLIGRTKGNDTCKK